MNNNSIFIGTYGTVLCIDHNTGKELWRTSLPGASYSMVTIYHEDGRVYAGSYGKIFILCAKTGKILAQNELVGQGYGIVTFTSKKSETSSVIPQPQPQMIQQPQLIQQPIPQLIQQPQPIQQPIPQFIQQPLMIQQLPFIQQPPLIQQPPMSVSPQLRDEPELIRHQPLNQMELQQQQNLLNQQFLQQSLLQQQMRNNPQDFMQQMLLRQQMQGQMIQNPQMQLQFQQLQFQNPQMVPQFPLDNEKLVNDHQLESDEELARKLDQELNGRNNNNNNNNNNIQIQRNVPQQNNNIVQPSKYISIDDIIFVSLNSYVTAINKYTAQEIWRSQVASSYGMALSLVFSGDKLLVGAIGNLHCLDALNGKELWKNNLPGLRYNNVSVATTTNNCVFRNSNSGALLYQN